MFASMQNMHVLGHKVKIEPVNFEGELAFMSAIDGDIINYGVERYRKLNGKHIEVNQTSAEDNHLHLQAETTASNVNIELDVFHKTNSTSTSKAGKTSKTSTLEYQQHLKQNEGFELERTIYIGTSRNPVPDDTAKKAIDYQSILEDSAKLGKRFGMK